MEGDQKIKSSSSKGKPRGPSVQQGDSSQQCWAVYWKLLREWIRKVPITRQTNVSLCELVGVN